VSNPKNPSGGPNTDDFDALLESLGEEKPAAAPPSPPKPSGPPRKTPVQMYVPLRPAAPPPRLAEPSSLSSLFDDDEVEMPTRMVDAGEIKRQAGVLAPAAPSGSAGISSRPRSAPPRRRRRTWTSRQPSWNWRRAIGPAAWSRRRCPG
jgi:hypothetical protein